MNRPTKITAALVAGALSLLFMVIYGGCNWITAQRSDVGIWYYSWERFIPFVPVMIVPYMSIDLFFVAGPFLCKSREELRTLARRITFAILVAGICFLSFPLKIAVSCPPVDGWMGAIFNFLHGFDQPYNLLPSLHITLRTILADLYARHTKGPLRVASHVWFSLIGFSTILTCQHHIVDVISGFILAAVCFYLFRENCSRLPVVNNPRIGVYYFAGAIVCMAAALVCWPWTGILYWPTASLIVTSVAYWRLGPVIYRKENGRLPLSTRLLLAPCLIGQRLSLWHYRRQCRAWDQVTPHVWIGARLDEHEAGLAIKQGVTAVLDLTAEFSENKMFLGLAYKNIPVMDLTELTAVQLRDAADFILQQSKSGIVYVHCKIGYSRSAAAVGAFLFSSGQAKTVEECFALMRRARPSIVLRPEVSVALNKYAALPSPPRPS